VEDDECNSYKGCFDVAVIIQNAQIKIRTEKEPEPGLPDWLESGLDISSGSQIKTPW
jgi:hypothetical protein